MNDLTAFRHAKPAMIVGRSFAGGPPPLGLGEPFALKGGDRLGPDGISFNLMQEHHPAFQRWVMSHCQALLVAERPWFRAAPVLTTGPKGAGRTHAARRLAAEADVPHVILNLTDPLIGASVASAGSVGEQLWALPVTVAMAATRCANPVVSVIGVDRVGEDVAAGLSALIDGETGRAWSEDKLETWIDFGEVAWIVQCDSPDRVPGALRDQAAHVVFELFPSGLQTSAALSILLEVIGDLGLDASDPRLDWPEVTRTLGPYHRSSAELYVQMSNAVRTAVRGPRADHTDISE